MEVDLSPDGDKTEIFEGKWCVVSNEDPSSFLDGKPFIISSGVSSGANAKHRLRATMAPFLADDFLSSSTCFNKVDRTSRTPFISFGMFFSDRMDLHKVPL